MKKVFTLVLSLVIAVAVFAACDAVDVAELEISGAQITAGEIVQNTDLSDIKVVVVYKDGTKDEPIDVTEDMVSGYDKTVLGEQEVTVTYKGVSKTFTITVVPAVTVTGLEVTGAFLNNKYVFKGTELPVDFKYKFVKSDATKTEEADVTADMISGYDKTVSGKQTVKFEKDGFEYNFDIIVADRAITTQAEFDAMQNDRSVPQNLVNFEQNECVVFTSGKYAIHKETSYSAAGVSMGPTNFYIAVKGVSIYGVGDVKFTSTCGGVGREQSAIMIAAQDIIIDGIGMDFADQQGSNVYLKLITVEAEGDNSVISNCTFKGAVTNGTVTFDRPMAVYFNATGTSKYLVDGNSFTDCRLYIANGTGAGTNDASDQIVKNNSFDNGVIAMVGKTNSGWDENATNYPVIENNTFVNEWTLTNFVSTDKNGNETTKTFKYTIYAISTESYEVLPSQAALDEYISANGLDGFTARICKAGDNFSAYICKE